MNKKIIFVSDLFLEQYVGGAELTTDALLKKQNKYEVLKINSNSINLEFIDINKNNIWIFGNYSNLSLSCMFKIMKNIEYYIIEYDYKFCEIRNPSLHQIYKNECSCKTSEHGRLVSMFMKNAKCLFFMSENQKNIYFTLFPYLVSCKNMILSSVFTDNDLEYMYNTKKVKNDKWIIFNSNNILKGTKEGIEYAKSNRLNYELVSNLRHREVLNKLSESYGLIFLPNGEDTCPRLVIEAKLLGCKLVCNDKVQHYNESWFQTVDSTFKYMTNRAEIFWNVVYESF